MYNQEELRNHFVNQILESDPYTNMSTLFDKVDVITDYIISGNRTVLNTKIEKSKKDGLEKYIGTAITKIVEWNDIIGVPKDENTQALYVNLITEEYNEFIDAVAIEDTVEQADACIDMIWVITGFMRSKGWSNETISSLFKEVERSNYSKFFTDEDSKVVCRKREDGKILKPDTFSPVDFSGINLGE